MTLWILGGVFALVGLPAAWLALHLFGKDRAIARWPRAPGTIVSSSLGSGHYSARDHSGYYRTYTSFRPEVRFTYTVEGVEHEGSKVAREVAATNNRRAVQACVDRYPPGSEVEVYYNPTDPGVAYLETRISIGGVILISFGGLFTAIALLMIAIGLFG
jgi:hypothetical protein